MNPVAKMENTDASPVAQNVDPMVSMIERVALTPDLPIERLERMMDLKDRHEQNLRRDRAEQAERAYNSAMAKAQSAMPTVKKSKENKHTKSTYADLSDIEEQAMPVVYQNGFSVSFNPAGKDDKGNLLIDWCLMHECGHTRTGQAGFPLDAAGAQGTTNKTGIQAMGSTMTYARRYLVCNLFNIATDDDTDGNRANTPQTITEQQYIEIRDLCEKAGVDEAVVCAAGRVQHLPELSQANFEAACKKLRKTIEAKAAS